MKSFLEFDDHESGELLTTKLAITAVTHVSLYNRPYFTISF